MSLLVNLCLLVNEVHTRATVSYIIIQASPANQRGWGFVRGTQSLSVLRLDRGVPLASSCQPTSEWVIRSKHRRMENAPLHLRMLTELHVFCVVVVVS